MKGSLVLSIGDTSGRMSRIGKSEISHGEILSVDEVLRRVDSVTLDDARRAAADVFGRPMALAVGGPFGKGAVRGGGGRGAGRRDAAVVLGGHPGGAGAGCGSGCYVG